MNIMDKPTLQEVKEYFKNAKEIKSLGERNILFDEIKKFEIDSNKDFWAITESGYYGLLYDCNSNQYAEIISYKEPLYQLTAKEIRNAYENPEYLKDTFKECFEMELEINRWIKDDTLPNYLSFFTDNGLKYGFDLNGKWYHSKTDLNPSDDKKNRYATESEIQEALVKEAIKRGYENGNHKRLDKPHWTEKNVENNYFFENGNLWLGTKNCANCVFKNGTWAEIIQVPTYTIPEAESKFNIKIKADV